jgi:fibronectin-binding autotransporter adhesin
VTTAIIAQPGSTNVTVNMLSGAQLNVAADAIVFNAGGQINNSSGAIIQGVRGINNTGPVTITNNGQISGTGGPGVIINGPGDSLLTNGGQIQGNGGSAVQFNTVAGFTQTLSITGNGSVNGNFVGSGDGDIVIVNGGNFNGGITINGNGNNSITTLAGHNINQGISITGNGQNTIVDGAAFNGGLFINGAGVNDITIESGAFINTSVISGSQTTINNAGTLNNGLSVSGAAGSVFNAGTINGINFSGPGPFTLTLAPQSHTNGTVQGTGSDTLQLGGVGTDSFNVSNIGPAQQYRGFSIFNKVDSSTWTLTGTGAQNWNISGGTLIGDTNSLQGPAITNNSTLIFNQGFNGTYAGGIGGNGAVRVQGGGVVSFTGANSYTGGTTINSGTLQLGNGGTSGSIVGDVVNNGAFVVNRSDTFTFGNTISGTGSFVQAGSGTTILTENHSYTGPTTVSAGTLRVSGSIAGSSGVTVNSGATLGGTGTVTGTVASTTINAGGTLSPGDNAIGALIVSGNLVFQSAASYLVQVSPVSASSTLVNGSTTLSGTLTANSLGGAYTVNQVFPVLSSTGPLTGTFNLATTGNFGGATVSLEYSATQVFLIITASGGGLPIWKAAPATSDWNTGTNWQSNTVPTATDIAQFNTSTITTIDVRQANTQVGALQFNAGAPAYTFNITGSGSGASSLIVLGDGVADISGNAPTFVVSGVSGATGTLQFRNASTANDAIIVTNAFGQTIFSDTSSGGLARFVTNAGGAVDFSGTSGPAGNNRITAGSIEGAGTYNLGANRLVVGLNGLSTTVSGTINDGGLSGGSGASLIKVGAGTLTLSGANTYTGATGVLGGTLSVSATGSITSNVINAATFNNAGTVTGSLTNARTAINSGTITNGLTNFAGTTENTGTINGGATVIGGTLNSNTTTSVVTGGLANAGTVNAAGVVSGAIANDNGVVTVTDNLTGNNTFTNNGTAQLTVTGGNFTGLTTLTNNSTDAGAISVASGRTLSADSIINGAGSTITNAGTLSSLTSPFSNAGTLNSNTATSVVTGGLVNAGTVNAAGAVNGAVTNAGTFTVAGPLTSDSTFANAVDATLDVSGAGAYTLQGMLTNSGVINVASGGQLIATAGGVTNNALGIITVAAGGTVRGDLNNAGLVNNNGSYFAAVATNTGIITNGATGNWTGDVASNAAGIINNGIWTGNVVSNTGIIDNNATWIGTVSNAGGFNNNAGGTVSGLLANTAGTTVNNGSLNGGANISGGIFTGTGTVTDLAVSGGTFAPGNGIPGSSMTVSGNLAFQSGALYLVQLNPATASFANVGGTATLGGATVNAVFASGSYVSKTYTILNAAGGVSGSFNALVNTNLPADFNSSLSYDANHVFLNLTLNFVPGPDFGSGLNANQQNVANALTGFFDRTGSIPIIFGALTPAGLTQVSGELGTGIIQSAIKADDMFLNLLLDPSVAGRAGGFGQSPAASRFTDVDEMLPYAARRNASGSERDAFALATKAPALAAQPLNRWSIWGAAYGGSATTDGNAVVGSHDTTARAYGVVGGADYRVSPDALVGFALAGGGTSFSIADALGTGRSDLFQAGVFARQNIGAAYLSGALAFGWHDVITNRTVTIGGTDVLRASFKAQTFSGRFEGGYRFATPFAGITPYAAAQAISFNLPAYAEQMLAGAGTFALNYAAQTTTATRTELGLRADKPFAMQDGIFTLRGRAAWAHDYNNDRAVTAVFQSLPGASFVVNGARADPDAALVSAAAEMKWINGFSLAVTFEGEFSGNTTSYACKGVARYTW